MQIRVVAIVMNIFTSLVFSLMFLAFIGYFLAETTALLDSGLITSTKEFLGMNQFFWIVILFLNVFVVGAFAYTLSRNVGLKLLSSLFYLMACLGVLFLLWPTGPTIDSEFLRMGHLILMAGFLIGALLLMAQSYLQSLVERNNARPPEVPS